MLKRLSELKRVFHKETRELAIDLTFEARRKLREVMMQPNPRLSEIPFIGIGEGNIVTDILFVNDGKYSQYSGLLRSGFLGSSVDKYSDVELWNKVIRTGNLDKVIFHGHSHPSGDTEINGIRYSVVPSITLLEPSTGGTRNMQGGGDLSYYNSLLRLNPNINIPFIAIVATTSNGIKLKIFELEHLLLAKSYKDIHKVPSKIVDL